MKKQGKTYVVPHRRQREGKTDYRLRLRLLKSDKPRFVVRKFSRNITCQIVEYRRDGDVTMVSSDSKELSAFGWTGNTGNVPSAYLTGLLCAVRAKKHEIRHAILDMGLQTASPGNRIFSALKGAIDGGLEIPHSEEVLPKEDRLSGKHIAAYAQSLKETEKYRKTFSGYHRNKAEPENLPAMFEETKKHVSADRRIHGEKKEHRKEAKEHKETKKD